MATIPQLYEVLGILSGRIAREGTPWLSVDTVRLQEQVIKHPDRFAQSFVEFVENQSRLIDDERKVFRLDPLPLRLFWVNRSIPCDVSKLLGPDFTIWRGPKEGSGLEGEEEQDVRSLVNDEINLSKISFKDCCKPEENKITGEQRLSRLKEDYPHLIRLDAQFAKALLAEPGQFTLADIRVKYGKTEFDFPGTVIRDSRGYRYCISLSWNGGVWSCGYVRLRHDSGGRLSSIVLKS